MLILFQATSPVASLFIAIQHNITVNGNPKVRFASDILHISHEMIVHQAAVFTDLSALKRPV